MNHVESPHFMRNVVVAGDTREVMQLLPGECVHLTFTSPPYYNARAYSLYENYQQYLDFLGEVFSLVHRITKEGRFLIVNTSPVIVPRAKRSCSSKRHAIPFDLHEIITSLGWEFIDDIIWAKQEASVKNRNGGFQQHRKPLGYKPNAVTEYVIVYRKATSKLIDWNMRQYSKEIVDESKIHDDFERTNLWHIAPVSDKIHSAVFPIKLCNQIIKYYSYCGDLVFDPFAGSGTVGVSARRLERYYFLTEQEPKYIERMKETIPNNMFDSSRFFDLQQFKEAVQNE